MPVNKIRTDRLVDFKEATDRAGQLGLTQADIAEALGIAHSTVRAGRLDASSPNYRKPPKGWRGKLSRAAYARSGELVRLAKDLGRGHLDDLLVDYRDPSA